MTKKEDKLQVSGPGAHPQCRKSTRAPSWADLSLQLRECADLSLQLREQRQAAVSAHGGRGEGVDGGSDLPF